MTRHRLAGKRAIVTAAARGIGRATALAFVAEGAVVYATDRDPLPLEQPASRHDNFQARQLDVTDAAAIFRLAAELGAVDILFNCTGQVPHGSILECDDATWDATFALNVRSMFKMIQAVLPAMIEGGGGSIVNVASVVSSVRGRPGLCAYGSSKAAVIGLTKSVAADYVGAAIRCNAICPGAVDTPGLQSRIAAAADPEARRRDLAARQPLGRLGLPKEVAALAVYLASDESAFTTGAVHMIDGGQTI